MEKGEGRHSNGTLAIDVFRFRVRPTTILRRPSHESTKIKKRRNHKGGRKDKKANPRNLPWIGCKKNRR